MNHKKYSFLSGGKPYTVVHYEDGNYWSTHPSFKRIVDGKAVLAQADEVEVCELFNSISELSDADSKQKASRRKLTEAL